MKKLCFILLLAGLFFQCSWRPKGQSQTEIKTSSTLDSINLYYTENLSEVRFGNIGPRAFLRKENNHRKIGVPISSATHADSVLSASLVALIESSRQSDSIKFVSRERWEPRTLQLDSTVIEGILYHPVEGFNAYYVIECVYLSGKRDTITLGWFASNGIYHSTQSYISKENGLHECMVYYLEIRDPEWASLNGLFLH